MATTTNDLDLNGNQSISLKITSNKVNDLFINDFAQLWTITDLDDVEHKVIYAKKQGIGDKLYIDVKGVPLFFDVMDNLRIYEEINSHLTANAFFTRVFKDTGFNFVLMDSFDAVQWEGLGKGETHLSAFQKGLNRYKAEFRISGNTVYFHFQIGRDTSIMYRHKLNASNIVQEIDAAAFWTHAKGFGDYAEGEEANAKLKREYTSPLAQIPGIGIRHAPPIYDGRVKVASVMDASLKTLVDESLKVSVSATIHSLKEQGYPIDQAELGDRVFLIDERIKLNDEVRVNNITKTRDWRGKILDINIVFGSEGIAKRHQSDIKAAVDRINELLEGKIKLPQSALDDAILIATKALQNAQTELQFPESGGILAVDKNNPNYVVLFNSAGFGVSQDGGNTFRTAMTGLGINADLIVVGTMLFDRIKGGTLILGGPGNGHGRMLVYNEEGDIVADLDAKEGGFDRLQIGDVISDSVVKVNTRSYELYVNPISGDDDNDGLSWATAFETVNRALDSIPKYNQGNITINVFIDGGSGVRLREVVLVYGFIGNGSITIDFRSRNSNLEGWITVHACINNITIQNITVRQRSGADSAVRAYNSARVYFDNIVVVGNKEANHGIYVHSSNADVRECEISNLGGEENCITGALGADVNIVDCTGSGKVGLRGHSGAKLSGFGTQPQGTVAAQNLTSGAFTHSTWSGGSPPPPPPPPPPAETTQSWARTSSESWRQTFGGQWSGGSTGSDVLQGMWGQYGIYKGLWFFGTAVRNAVNGKTIKRIRVRLTRANNSGHSSSVNAIIRPHAYASKPTGEPSFLGASHSVGYKWGESKWVTLPSSFHAFFANGQAYGIGIYTTSANNTNYMRFSGNAEIEITYA